MNSWGTACLFHLCAIVDLQRPSLRGTGLNVVFLRKNCSNKSLLCLFDVGLFTEKPMPKITMYTTGFCPYCVRAEQLLIRKGVTEIHKVRIDLDAAERDIMMSRTGKRTVPQIYIDEQHIGGFDDLAALDHAGKLGPLLAGQLPVLEIAHAD